MAGAFPKGGVLIEQPGSHAAAGSEPRATPPPPNYLKTLRDQRSFIVVFVLSAALTSLALTYAFSEKYESYAAISYRVQEVTRFKPQQNEALGSPAPAAPFKVIGSTLQEVLKSDAILRDTVVALRLHERPPGDYSGPWYRVWYTRTKEWLREHAHSAWQLLKYGRLVEEDAISKAVEELRSSIKVTNRDSYIFHLKVRDKYPDRAARIADHVAQLLAAWLLEYDRQPGRSRVDQLQSLLETKRKEIDDRRRDIQALLAENEIGSVQLETEKLTERLSALQLEEARLASDIARAEARMSSVQSKLLVKERILSGNGGVYAEPGQYIPPEDFKKLASQNVFDDVELQSLLAKRASLRQSIDAVNARLRRQPGVQARLDTLRLNLSSLEREYTLLNDGVQEAEVRSTSSVSEVRILHPALVPTSPVAPIKIYHVGLSAGLGLLLAVGLAYLLEYLGLRFLFAPPPRRRREAPAPVEPPVLDPVRDGVPQGD